MLLIPTRPSPLSSRCHKCENLSKWVARTNICRWETVKRVSAFFARYQPNEWVGWITNCGDYTRWVRCEMWMSALGLLGPFKMRMTALGKMAKKDEPSSSTLKNTKRNVNKLIYTNVCTLLICTFTECSANRVTKKLMLLYYPLPFVRVLEAWKRAIPSVIMNWCGGGGSPAFSSTNSFIKYVSVLREVVFQREIVCPKGTNSQCRLFWKWPTYGAGEKQTGG